MGRRQAKEKEEAKPVRRLSGREPARLSRPSLLSKLSPPRQVPPRQVRTTAQRRTFFQTKWRQIPPHTGESRARTLLLLSACPPPILRRNNSLVWTEFLNPTSIRGGDITLPLHPKPPHAPPQPHTTQPPTHPKLPFYPPLPP